MASIEPIEQSCIYGVEQPIQPPQEISDEKCEQILQDLGIKLENPKLTPDEHRRLTRFIAQNQDMFARSLTDLPGTDIWQHHIDTGDALPVRQREYPHTPKDKLELERQTGEMRTEGILENSESMWSSPVLLVKKASGELRLVVDYRKLNMVTRPMHFPLPLLTDVLDNLALQKVRFLTSLDMRSGFWQIKLDQASKEKTAFTLNHREHLQFTRLPYGLSNSCQTFSMALSKVFRGLPSQSLVLYVDDILIISPDFDHHLTFLDQVFQRLRSAKLKLHPKKCRFALDSLVFLGFRISPDGIQIDDSKIKAVREYPIPKSVKHIRMFLGLSGYHRRWIKNYSIIAKPLFDLLKQDVKFEWTLDCQNAFESLRDAMITAPVLIHPDLNKPYIINTDSSKKGLGYVLCQKGEDGLEHPIAYGGRSLRGAEYNYSTTELEALAVVTACKEFHSYIANQEVTVFSDNISLSWLNTIKNNNGRLLRWALLLQGYNIRFVYKEGRKNFNADVLSRRPYPDPGPIDPRRDVTDDDLVVMQVDVIEPVTLVAVDVETINPAVQTITQNPIPEPIIIDQAVESDGMREVRFEFGSDPLTIAVVSDPIDLPQQQREDPDLGRIIRFLTNDELPSVPKLARKTVYESSHYALMDDDILYYNTKPIKDRQALDPVTMLIAIPQSLRLAILKAYHDQNAHPAFERTLQSISLKYFFPNMASFIKTYCQGCKRCQLSKRHYGAHPVPLNCIPPDDLFERWHMDILQLPTTREGYKYLLVVVESLSRYPECFPMKTQTAEEIAEALYTGLFARYGMCRSIVSDRGANLMSQIVSNLCKLFNVRRVLTSSYRPQGNSPVERFNEVIIAGLRCYCDRQEDWPEKLPAVLAAYRATPTVSATAFSPFFVMHGREMLLPLDAELIPPAPESQRSLDVYMRQLLPRLEIMRKIALENVAKHQAIYKQQFDKHAKPTEYEIGSYVLMYNPKVPLGQKPKLFRRWLGPYYIIDKVPPCLYRLRHCKTNDAVPHPVHVERLKPYFDFDDELAAQPQPLPDDDDTTFDDEISQPLQEVDPLSTQTSHDATAPSLNDANSPGDLTQLPTQLIPVETESNRPSSESTTTTKPITTTPSQNPVDQPWIPVRKIHGVKKTGNKRFYRVEWDLPDAKPEWIKEDDVSDFAKHQYHIRHTLEGKLRRELRHKNRKTSVHSIMYRPQHKKRKITACPNCVEIPCYSLAQCPAYDVRCLICTKLGHVAKVCPITKYIQRICAQQ